MRLRRLSRFEREECWPGPDPAVADANAEAVAEAVAGAIVEICDAGGRVGGGGEVEWWWRALVPGWGDAVRAIAGVLVDGRGLPRRSAYAVYESWLRALDL